MPGAALAAFLVAAVAPTFGAQAPDVQVRAVPEFVAVRPGAAFRVAVQLQIPQGWHIGWTNPGASGLATTISWQTRTGVEGAETAFPYPETDDGDGGIAHVYRGAVVLFSLFTAAPDLSAPVELSAELEWGLCRVQCVLQRRTLQVSLPVGHGATRHPSAWAEVQLAERSLPVRVPARDVHGVVSGDSVTVTVSRLPNGPPPDSWLTFFPLEPGRRSVVGRVHGAVGGVTLTLPASILSGSPPGRLAGVLVGAHAPGAPPALRPLAVDVTVGR